MEPLELKELEKQIRQLRRENGILEVKIDRLEDQFRELRRLVLGQVTLNNETLEMMKEYTNEPRS